MRPSPPPGFTLVLGGGGGVGVGFICGVLQAVEDIAGVDVAAADLVIGTSAGAVVAADLRLGRSIRAIVEDRVSSPEGERHGTVMRAWTSRSDLARRVVGASAVAIRTTVLRNWRIPAPPRSVQRAFPASLMRVRDPQWASRRFPDAWPDAPLWLIAFDLDRGRRAILRRDGPLKLPLPRAVEASCAVPGVYAPVRAGRRRLVDGGLRSPTNADLAASATSGTVIVVAPLALEPGAPRTVRSTVRRRFNRQLEREVGIVERTGKRVIVFRPSAADLGVHGVNILSDRNMEVVFDRTLARTAQRLRRIDPLGL